MSPPYLWGEWRCTAEPDFYTAECPACGAELWVAWTSDRWRVSCANGCAIEDIDAGAHRQQLLQQARRDIDREAAASVEPDDSFYGLPAAEYIAVLTGHEADGHGFVRCPFHGDGAERTPSLHATGMFWFCHACRRGGTIYDFGAELWGMPARGYGFGYLRDRLRSELMGQAWPAS